MEDLLCVFTYYLQHKSFYSMQIVLYLTKIPCLLLVFPKLHLSSPPLKHPVMVRLRSEKGH